MPYGVFSHDNAHFIYMNSIFNMLCYLKIVELKTDDSKKNVALLCLFQNQWPCIVHITVLQKTKGNR